MVLPIVLTSKLSIHENMLLYCFFLYTTFVRISVFLWCARKLSKLIRVHHRLMKLQFCGQISPLVFQNGGHCDFSVSSSKQFLIVPCVCVTGYAGTYCENDEDGCADRPCWPGVDCTDVLARDLSTTPAGYTCGSCPTHLDGNGITCTGRYWSKVILVM